MDRADDNDRAQDDASRFREGAPLVTRADFERAERLREELLGGPVSTSTSTPSPVSSTTPTAPHLTSPPLTPTAALSPEERRAWTTALPLVAVELATTPRPAVLDGESWRATCRGARHSQRGRCGRCWLCEWEQHADRHARPQREDPRRTAKSVDEWFEAWVAFVEDPAGAKSSIGIQLERMADGLSYGGSFVAREPSAIRAATLFVGVEAALVEAAKHARGENQPMCAEVVLDGLRALIVGLANRSKKRGVTRTPMAIEEVAARWSEASEREGGEAVSARAAKQLVGRWRRLAAVELAARGLIRTRRGDEDAVEVVRVRLTTERAVGGVEGESGKAKAR